MGLKEIIENMRERKKDKKELIRKMDEQLKVEELLQERRKSSNERELERFWKEDKEERIKLQLEEMRKKRDKDMKEKNMFSKKSNMFSNSESILKNNPKLLKGGMKLIK